VAITFVNNALGATNSTTSFSITLPATQAGDIILLEVSHRGTGLATVGGTYSGGAFTNKRNELYGGSTRSVQLWWSRATGNHSGQTVTGSGLTNSCAAIVTIYRGCVASGDPIEDIDGENNAAGNENSPAIDPVTNGAWIVLTVGNQDDLAVTSQSCTSPGALTIRAERLSTGGTDSAVCHASAEKATAGNTGTFTWAQTDGGSGSFAYALTPAGGATTYTGSGAVTLPLITASGSGRIIRKGSGAVTLPLLTASGSGDVTPPGPATHEGAGATTLPLITASGSGRIIRKGSGAVTLPLLTASGAGKRTVKGTGSPALPLLSAAGAGKRAVKGSGAPQLPLLAAAGTGKKTVKGTGSPTLPLLTALGSGINGELPVTQAKRMWPSFMQDFIS
jgi:hypothetical protein